MIERRWYVLGATSLGAFAATVMGTSVNVALPSLVDTFDTSFPVVQWVVLAYLLSTSVLLPIIGRLADMLGKKAIFVSGFGIYVLGSLLCGLAPSVEALIGLRAVQGIGSAILTAIGLAIVADVFPAGERGRAIGVAGAVLSSGVVIGPTLGGFLVDALGWEWVFLAGVPVGLVGAALALRFVPAYGPGEHQRFDIAGASLLFVTLLALSLALTVGQALGFADPRVLAMFGLSLLGLAGFVVVERRVAQPLLALDLFTDPTLTVGLVSGFVTFVSIAGTIFLMPFFLENVLGYPPAQVGLLMSVTPILLVVVAPLAGWLADRYGERPITVIGLSFILTGYLMIGTLNEQSSAVGFIVRFLPLGLGMGAFQTPNNSAIMGSAPRHRSGVAGGLLALTRALGQTAGIAVLGSLWAGRVMARTLAAESGGGTGGVSARVAGDLGGDATAAPPALQVAGLHDMLLVVQIAVGLALLLCVWDLLRRRSEGVDQHVRADDDPKAV
ncbi:MAG: DHA2 family efflux MFS transporter permease subunit [Trueperaceae bacterium]